jgi:hypothetical protein
MTLQRHTRSIDGTIPVPALLYNDEENYASQDSVGIYDGYGAFPGLSHLRCNLAVALLFPSARLCN